MPELKISADGRFCIAPDGTTAVFDLDRPGPCCWREPTLPELTEIAAQMTWVPVPLPDA